MQRDLGDFEEIRTQHTTQENKNPSGELQHKIQHMKLRNNR